MEKTVKQGANFWRKNNSAAGFGGQSPRGAQNRAKMAPEGRERAS
jgi:hypothetical protein